VLIHRGKCDGTIRENLQETAAASALIGATEAMIRDRLIAQRVGKDSPFTDDDVRSIVFAFLDGMANKA